MSDKDSLSRRQFFPDFARKAAVVVGVPAVTALAGAGAGSAASTLSTGKIIPSDLAAAREEAISAVEAASAGQNLSPRQIIELYEKEMHDRNVGAEQLQEKERKGDRVTLMKHAHVGFVAGTAAGLTGLAVRRRMQKAAQQPSDNEPTSDTSRQR